MLAREKIMVDCVIETVLANNVYILDNKGNKINISLELYGIKKPQKGDKLLIHEVLLDKNSNSYTQPYTFALDSEIDPRDVKENDDKEFALIKLGEIIYSLKRIYG